MAQPWRISGVIPRFNSPLLSPKSRLEMKNTKNENKINQELAAMLDGAVAAPEHHQVLFENERVRVLNLRVQPGETVPVHTHKWASVSYVLSIGDFISYDAVGNVKVDTRTTESALKPGAVMWQPPAPPPHSLKNISDLEIYAISVELKD